MSVEFRLDIDKVIAAATYIASQGLPDLTVGKLSKLMFLADKHHLVKYGRPITGDHYEAMEDGPVPSFTYNLFKREILRKPFTAQGRSLAKALEIDTVPNEPPRFRACAAFDPQQLSRSDIMALDKTLQQFAHLSFEDLSVITHKMVAYARAWDSRGIFRKAARMKFEDFFEDDVDAIAGAREEMVENYHLYKTFAKP